MAANSQVIGLLRILLSASSAEWETTMKRSADSAKAWSRELKQVGQQATQVGAALTKTLTLPIAGVGIAAAKLAIEFESSFAGVRKTVEGTEPELQQLAQGFRNLSKTIPVNVNDLNRLGEAAGALGIPRDKVLDFANVMARLGVSTDLTADQAANAIARIQNIFGAAGKDTQNLASTLVALGNAGASTEKEIVEMGLRIAGAGHTVGLTQAQVLAFASTMASVGINAEAGGSAISRVFLKINDAVAKGGGGLKEFARVAGVSTAEFKKSFETDAAGATQQFIAGLGRLKSQGENINQTIEGLTGKNIILKDTLFRLSGAGGELTRQLGVADKAWKSNTALTKESEERFKTTQSQLILLGNRVKDVGITLGNALGPAIGMTINGLNVLIPVLEKMVGMFAALPAGVQTAIVALAAIVAAAGPVIYIFGQILLSASAITGAFTKKGIATRALVGDLDALGTGAATTTSKLGLLGKAAGVAAAFFIGWEIGKLISDLTGLDTAVARTVASFEGLSAARARAMGKTSDTGVLATQISDLQAKIESLRKQGFGDSAEVKEFTMRLQTLQSKMDVVSRAVSHGAAATITYTDAIKFNEQWELKRIAGLDQTKAALAKAKAQQDAINLAITRGAAATINYSDAVKFNTEWLKANNKGTDDNTESKKKNVALTSEQVQVLALLEKAHAHESAQLAMDEAAWKRWEQTVSTALSKIATNPVLLKGRNLSGIAPQVDAGGAGNMAGYTAPMIKANTDWVKSLGDVTRAFDMLAASSSGSVSRIVGSIGNITSALQQAAGTTKKDGSEGKLGILTAMFDADVKGAEKWAAAIQIGLQVVSGAMAVWNDTAGAGTKAAGALSGAMSGAKAGAMFGPYGMAIGAVAGAVTGMIRAMSAGRREVKAFAESFDTAAAGTGFDELQQRMLTLGDDYERLWKKLTQQTGRGDQAGARAVIAEIQAALGNTPEALAGAAGFQTTAQLQAVADKAKKVYDYMVASGQYSASEIAKAFEASATAQKALLGETAQAQEESLDTITAKYAESFEKLDSEYKTLSESVAKEAEEEFMGIVETQERARMEQIATQKKELEIQRDAEIAAKKSTFDEVLDAGTRAHDDLQDYYSRHPLDMPWRFRQEGTAPGGGSSPDSGYIPAGSLDRGYSSSSMTSWERTAPRSASASQREISVKVPLYIDTFGTQKIAEATAKVYV